MQHDTDIIDQLRIARFLEECGSAGTVRPEWVRCLADDRYAMAKPLLFHWTVIEGSFFDTIGYDNRWCFADSSLALAALEAWPVDPPAGYEPEGWHRHPKSGRRRENADPSMESYAP